MRAIAGVQDLRRVRAVKDQTGRATDLFECPLRNACAATCFMKRKLNAGRPGVETRRIKQS